MNVSNDSSFTPADPVTFGPEERGFVYAVARKIVGSPEEADDVTQDTLLVAYRNRAAFRGESRYRTWLYRIAFTTALGHLRRRKRSRESLADTELELGSHPSLGPTPEDQVCEAEVAERIRHAVEDLAPPYRDVVLARVTATEPEVAERLGITIANVKIRAHRARKHLKLALADVG